ncbi:GUN4 domain-containing protein [Ancylothrix sp. C2]|uniref:GUN4 domain-containing protein n=1 Tax=Ancylothrix sp. D3o TaxID=2953691 RepID=UPI0021BB6F69|nr:GUN4 domain-containing protein [Ancylothrix sp. D3o]MCT7951962.1 GUN4 domain-containing protein [Ancylothrix sp. D3o]
MRENTASPAPQTYDDLTGLSSQLRTAPEKTQIQLLQQFANPSEAAVEILMQFLSELSQQSVTPAAGKAYQMLLQSKQPKVTEFLTSHFPCGVIPLFSERDIDYKPLFELLARCEFEAADRLTIQLLCQLAGEGAVTRKWLYFTEIDNIPGGDLQTIDKLWFVYSEGKFGYRVQREMWLSLSKNWDKFWPKIGWKNGNNWTRYPQQFTWNLSAPRGHLPLSNQLRGVRTMEKLLNHPCWQSSL